MDIFLIRHAQSKGNELNIVQGKSDNGLSDLGKEQAEKLSNHFNIGDLHAIYSSDLSRAFYTAEPTAKKLGIEIKKDPDLREADFGIWEELTYDGIKEQYPNEHSAWFSDYYARPEWFESFESHFKRIKNALGKILKSHRIDEKVAVFTHGGSIKTQIGYFNNLTGSELAQFATVNCSLTLIRFNPTQHYEKGKLIYYNKIVIDPITHRMLQQ